MTAGNLALLGYRRIIVGAISVAALSGCQDAALSQTKAVSKAPAGYSAQPSSTPKKLTFFTPKDLTVEAAPIYVDLGPIETANLYTVPVSSSPTPLAVEYRPVVPIVERSSLADPKSIFDRPIPASEATTTQQLSSSSTGRQSPFEIEQASGTQTDRCDPNYWRGTPPANLQCDELVTANPLPKEARRALPGTYIRFTPRNDVLLQDAELVVREGVDHNRKISDDTIGTILFIETARQQSLRLPPELSLKDIPAEKGVGVKFSDGTRQPSVILPDS